MRLALPGSALVHIGALGLVLAGFSWPEAEDAAPPAPLSIDIVPMATITANASQPVLSDNAVSALSAGSTASPLAPLSSETLEPMSENIEPVTPPPLDVAEAEPVAAVAAARPLDLAEAEPVELASTMDNPARVQPPAPLSPQAPADLAPLASADLAPVSVEDLNAAPVPHALSFTRPAEPIVHKPRPHQAQRPPAPAAPAGNGGADAADSTASSGGARAPASSSGNGGSADVARYPSQVIGKLRAALRRNGGERGEVVVRFTVLAGGQLAGVSILRSSGRAGVDQAGLAIVRRAAPFPPIPAGAGRANWTFDVPLAFGG